MCWRLHLQKAYLTVFVSWLLLCEVVVTLNNISPRIVQTHYGALRGIIDRFGHGSPAGLHPVEKFLGVPYATPPIKGLRFMPPLTPSPWDGVKTMDRLASSCPQQVPQSVNSSGRYQRPEEQQPKYFTRVDSEIQQSNNFNEDCLYLNIFYPTIDGQLTSMEKPPVVLIVEARTWQQSGANNIDASVFATRGRLMVATVNFRLGIFGFLKTSPKDNPQGNYGMLDVIAAIHWLRLNAGAFGGDSGRLTLIGIGQGAAIVHLLMLSPMARGLFHGSILLGGSAFSPTAVQPNHEDIRQKIATLAGCWDPSTDVNAGRYDLAPCLRKLSAQQLLNISSVSSPIFTPLFAPFIDGFISAATTKESHDSETILRDVSRMKTESFLKCDLLVGLSTYELEKDFIIYNGIPFGGPLSEEQRDSIFRTLVRNIYKYHKNEIFAVLRNEYTDWEYGVKNNSAIVQQNLYEAISDGLVVSPIMELLRYHSGPGHTYLYHLNYPLSLTGASTVSESNHQMEELTSSSNEVRGSFHEDGVFYLLGLSLNSGSGFPSSKVKNEETEISEQLMAYIAGFCYAGDPNEHGGSHKEDKSNTGLIFWEPYTNGEQRYLSLGLRSQTRSHYRSHKMSVWLRLIPQLHQPEEGVLINHHNIYPSAQNNHEKDQTSKNGEVDGSSFRSYGTTRRSNASPARLDNNEPPELNKTLQTNSSNSVGKETQTTSECPTLPTYTVVGTFPITTSSEAENSEISTNKTYVPTSWFTNVWSYTTMLAITIATGLAFIIVNLMIITCFCVMGRRSSSSFYSKEPIRQQPPALPTRGLESNHSKTLATRSYDNDIIEGEKTSSFQPKVVLGGLSGSVDQMLFEAEGQDKLDRDYCGKSNFSTDSVGSIIDLTKMHPLLVQGSHLITCERDDSLLSHEHVAVSRQFKQSFSFGDLFFPSSSSKVELNNIHDHQQLSEQRRLRISSHQKRKSRHEIAV